MNRLEWILGILLVVLLLTVVILSLLFWFRPGQTVEGPPANSATARAQLNDDIEPTSVFEGRTAMWAYAAAQRTAVTWRDDAQLINASATWPQGATARQILDGQTTWGFTFYSPAAEQIAVISVVEDEANLISEGEHKRQTPLLGVSAWNLDSDEAIQTLLNEGGAQFINEEGITTLNLVFFADDQRENGRLEWMINLFSPQNDHALRMRLDATSGEVLENETIP